MSRSVWWFLAMEFHTYPNPGHGTGKAQDCHECGRIARLIERISASSVRADLG